MYLPVPLEQVISCLNLLLLQLLLTLNILMRFYLHMNYMYLLENK